MSAGEVRELVPRQVVSAGNVRFKIIEKLGSGGNSSVYMVQCQNGEHRGLLFAIKFFDRPEKADRLARFNVELEFLKTTEHPAVVKVNYDGSHSYSNGSSVPFYITEYMPKTLHDAMKSGMLMLDKVTVAVQMISALAYLTESNPPVVHRDIKPENIFIKGRTATLGDFGLLKALGDSESAERFSIKSLSKGARYPRFYPTPDLVAYSKDNSVLVTNKSDVFQLGLVFSEMFCGQIPLEDRDVYDVVVFRFLGEVPGSLGSFIR
jgi:serine/threonine protein kinase